MGELEQKREIVVCGDVLILQVSEELARQFQEIRRLCAVMLHEATNERVPSLWPVYLPDDGKRSRQQAAQVVEEQVAINRHTPVLDAVGRGLVLRIANVRGERVLLALELGDVSHSRPPSVQTLLAVPLCGVPHRATPGWAEN